MKFCCRWAFPTRGQRLGSVQHGHTKCWKRPSTAEPLIGLFFLHNSTEKLPFTLSKVVPAVE